MAQLGTTQHGMASTASQSPDQPRRALRELARLGTGRSSLARLSTAWHSPAQHVTARLGAVPGVARGVPDAGAAALPFPWDQLLAKPAPRRENHLLIRAAPAPAPSPGTPGAPACPQNSSQPGVPPGPGGLSPWGCPRVGPGGSRPVPEPPERDALSPVAARCRRAAGDRSHRGAPEGLPAPGAAGGAVSVSPKNRQPRVTSVAVLSCVSPGLAVSPGSCDPRVSPATVMSPARCVRGCASSGCAPRESRPTCVMGAGGVWEPRPLCVTCDGDVARDLCPCVC